MINYKNRSTVSAGLLIRMLVGVASNVEFLETNVFFKQLKYTVVSLVQTLYFFVVGAINMVWLNGKKVSKKTSFTAFALISNSIRKLLTHSNMAHLVSCHNDKTFFSFL